MAKKQSKKQAVALALVKSGVPVNEAMRSVGYAKNTIRNAKANFLDKPQVKPILQQYQEELISQGIDVTKRVSTLKDMLEADKDDKADYKTRAEALKIINQIEGIAGNTKEKQPTRRVTLEEFEQEINTP